MTTVGYGDFYPKSNLGRVMGIICSFYGVYFTSLFIITLENLLVMSIGEEKSYDLLIRLIDKDKLRVKAVNVLTAKYKYKKMMRKKKATLFQKKLKAKNLRNNMLKF